MWEIFMPHPVQVVVASGIWCFGFQVGGLV